MKKLSVEKEIFELKDAIRSNHRTLNLLTDISLSFLSNKIISNHFKNSINEKCRGLKREIIFCETNLWNRLLVLTAGNSPSYPVHLMEVPQQKKKKK